MKNSFSAALIGTARKTSLTTFKLWLTTTRSKEKGKFKRWDYSPVFFSCFKDWEDSTRGKWFFGPILRRLCPLIPNNTGAFRLHWLLACILCIKTWVLTSKNAIKKLSIKLGEYSWHYLTALAWLDRLKIATGSLREASLEEKNARKAHDRKVTTDNMVKLLRKEQRLIQEGRNNKQPVLKAEVTDFITGITKTVCTQE